MRAISRLRTPAPPDPGNRGPHPSFNPSDACTKDRYGHSVSLYLGDVAPAPLSLVTSLCEAGRTKRPGKRVVSWLSALVFLVSYESGSRENSGIQPITAALPKSAAVQP